MLLALVFEVIDHFFACNDVAANMRKGLAERTGDQIHVIPGVTSFDQTSAGPANYTGAMRVIYHQPCAVLFAKRDNFTKGGQVTILRVNAVYDHQYQWVFPGCQFQVMLISI